MFKKLALFLPLLLALQACEHPGPPTPQVEPNFTRYQPIYLDVGSIDIVQDYESPMKPPNVEHLIPYSPDDMMHIWIKDRLRSVGTEKTLQISVKDASVISTLLKQPDGVLPSLNNSNRYDARLEVEMRIYGTSDVMSLASIDVTATASTTIAAKASLAERKAIFNKMMFDLMEHMNAELEKNIYRYFGSYINYSRGV